MDVQKILAVCDHTLLRQDAKIEDYYQLCDEAVRYGAASVCVPPYHVHALRKHMGNTKNICTVIAFPNGYNASSIKVREAEYAIEQGADEIDMVINLGLVKDRRFDEILDEIRDVRKACEGGILKVIIETCLLSEAEKIAMCGIVSESGADFIKTSTGFSTGGATREDVALLRKYCKSHVKIKASGGISSLDDAQAFMDLGADRLGSSRLIKLAREFFAD